MLFTSPCECLALFLYVHMGITFNVCWLTTSHYCAASSYFHDHCHFHWFPLWFSVFFLLTALRGCRTIILWLFCAEHGNTTVVKSGYEETESTLGEQAGFFSSLFSPIVLEETNSGSARPFEGKISELSRVELRWFCCPAKQTVGRITETWQFLVLCLCILRRILKGHAKAGIQMTLTSIWLLPYIICVYE